MADINTTLGLDIDEAFRDLDRLGDAIDRALGRVEIRVDPTQAQRQLDQLAQDADRALSDVDVNIDSTGAARLNEELAHAERNLTDAEREARQLERTVGRVDNEARQVDNTTKGMAGNFRKLEDAAKGVIAAFAAIGVGALFGQAIRGANAAVQSFAQLEDSINAVNVIFGQGSAAVLKFGETAAASAGLSQQAFNQAVTPIGSLLQNFGFDAREAADASVILVQRAADLASVLGGSVQDALLAVGAALRGEADPLERYGASISAIRVEQFALAEGLAATKAQLTPAILLQARYGLILADTARVAGDFSNTAGDLANAQRSASAAVQNFVAEIGEQLAPALAAMVSLLPEVLAGIRQLVPGFAAAADSAAAFFNEIDQGGGGFREPIQTVSAGLGLLSDAFLGFGDILQASFDFTNANRQLDQFNTRIANTTARIGSNFLARELDAGTDKALAFANSLSFLAREQENIQVFSESFRAFAFAADLSAIELQDVTQFLLDNAVAAGLSAEEIKFLELQFATLRNTLQPIGNEVQQALNSMRGFGAPFETITTTFTTFAGATETGQARASAALEQLAADAEAQAARTAAAFDLFADLPDDIEGSFAAAVDALREQVQAAFDFDVNIALLRSLDLDALADDFERQGLAAAGQLEQAINDIPLAISADALLQGMGVVGEEAFDALVQRFVDAEITPAEAKRLGETLSSPQVIAAANEAAGIVAVKQSESYGDRLNEELDQLIPETGALIGGLISAHWSLGSEADTAARDTAQSYVDGIIGFNIPDRIQEVFDSLNFVIDFFDAGAESASTFAHGFQEELASRQDDITGSITEAIDSAIQRDSPPKLFRDAGRDSAEAFVLGFGEADLVLRKPDVGVTGTATSAVSGTAGAGGINVQVITNNPTQQDEVSDVARMGQIASSIAASYRSVVPNGM